MLSFFLDLGLGIQLFPVLTSAATWISFHDRVTVENLSNLPSLLSCSIVTLDSLEATESGLFVGVFGPDSYSGRSISATFSLEQTVVRRILLLLSIPPPSSPISIPEMLFLIWSTGEPPNCYFKHFVGAVQNK